MPLDRERARKVLMDYFETSSREFTDDFLDALEECVLPSADDVDRNATVENERLGRALVAAEAKLAKIKARVKEWSGSTRSRITPNFAAREIQAILEEDQP